MIWWFHIYNFFIYAVEYSILDTRADFHHFFRLDTALLMIFQHYWDILYPVSEQLLRSNNWPLCCMLMNSDNTYFWSILKIILYFLFLKNPLFSFGIAN